MLGAVEATAANDSDPENKYLFAGILAVGGYRYASLRLLRKAVEGRYLCSPMMDKDPCFDSIRRDPAFAAIRAESVRRQKEFLVARRAATPAG